MTQRGTSTEILIGGRNLASIVLWSHNCHSKTAAVICLQAVVAAGRAKGTPNKTLLQRAQELQAKVGLPAKIEYLPPLEPPSAGAG